MKLDQILIEYMSNFTADEYNISFIGSDVKPKF